MRADRLVAVLLLLQARGRVTAAEVAAELEVSERTARRDLEALGVAGLPVYSLQGRGGGWFLAGGARTDLSGLTVDETRALFLTAGAGDPAGGPAVRSALRKLVRALPEQFRADAAAASEAVLVDRSGWDRRPAEQAPPRHLDAVQRAVVTGVRVELEYVARDATRTTRAVDPWGLVSKGTRWYLVAGTEAGRRTFRVDRIHDVRLTDERVERPTDFDLAEVWGAVLDAIDERRTPLRARLAVRADAVGLVRAVLGSRVRIGPPRPDGRIDLDVRGHSEQALAGELAGFGDRVEVLEPAGLREAVAGTARQLLDLYGPPPGGDRGDLDPLGLRDEAPILDRYLSFVTSPPTPFTIPGHKQRTDLVGRVVAGDVPLHGGVDTIGLTGDVLGRGERAAARLWGADWCRFSVGGSTHGNQALALAVAEPGSKVIVSRTLHRSMLIGLVLAGLEPVWVRPWIDPASGLPGAVAADAVADALRRHPDARAVLLGDPSYAGGFGDLRAHAEIAHRHGVPLVVDAAWAAHFGFHPALPDHALAQGADAMVVSAHKTLPAWSQAAIVLAMTDRLDPDRLERAFDASHTTSPSGAILASTDAARALLERHGRRLLGGLVERAAEARAVLREVPGVTVLDGAWVDPAKLVVLLHGTTAHGHAVERDLVDAGLPVEMADRDTIVPMLTVADGARHVERLVRGLEQAIRDSAARHDADIRAVVPSPSWTVEPHTVMSPRQAFFAPHETVPAAAAAGRVCAELVAPYPPGVPVLAPGERIDAATVAALAGARASGARIAYAADPTLATLQVVAAA